MWPAAAPLQEKPINWIKCVLLLRNQIFKRSFHSFLKWSIAEAELLWNEISAQCGESIVSSLRSWLKQELWKTSDQQRNDDRPTYTRADREREWNDGKWTREKMRAEILNDNSPRPVKSGMERLNVTCWNVLLVFQQITSHTPSLQLKGETDDVLRLWPLIKAAGQCIWWKHFSHAALQLHTRNSPKGLVTFANRKRVKWKEKLYKTLWLTCTDTPLHEQSVSLPFAVFSGLRRVSLLTTASWRQSPETNHKHQSFGP